MVIRPRDGCFKCSGAKGAIQGSESSVKGKLSTIVVSGLENLKSETSSETQDSMQLRQVCTTDTSWVHDEWRRDEWNDGWSYDVWNDDWSCSGWHGDCQQTCNTSVSSFSLEISEWVTGDGTFHDWIPYGEAWFFFFFGYDENGLPRSLNRRLTDAHQVLCSAASASAPAPLSGCAEIACKEPQGFHFGTRWWLHDSDAQ